MTSTNLPSLLLLPGLANDARLWQPQARALGDLARVTVADLTGAESIAALAAAALAQAPAPRFALAGLSMGGYVALEIMRQAPERVIALALLDTSARPDSTESIENRTRLMQRAEHHYPAVISELLHKLVHPAQLADAALMALITAMALGVGKEVFVRQQRAILGRIDSRPFLAAITCPTLVLCGREDVITPLPMHEEMHAAIAGSICVRVNDCGHLSTLSQPESVNKALLAWLTQALQLEASRQPTGDVLETA